MKQIEPHSVVTQSLEWGAIKWFVSPSTTVSDNGADITCDVASTQ